jgi:polysaccharide deacetylase 2 family uncharacterized protein YibQ
LSGSPSQPPAGQEPARRWPRGLIVFWAVVLAGIAGGAAYLQYLGPPPAALAGAGVIAPKTVTAAAPPAGAAPIGQLTVEGSLGANSKLQAGLAIPPPEPGLLAPSADNPKWLVPQIGADGATPMQVYAASDRLAPNAPLAGPDTPEVAIMVAGLGDDISQSLTATSILPAAVSLALTPYGAQLPATEAAARATGHEMILVLPMPALLASLPLTQNQGTLDWAMSQIQGYAGVTDAFGPDMSGGFMNDLFSKSWLLTNIATRGLFFIEGNTDAETNPLVWGRTADEVIDPANGMAEESAQLDALAAAAQSQHTALGILLNPTPEAVKALAAWCATLPPQGIRLVPVSALVVPPVTAQATTASAKQ